VQVTYDNTSNVSIFPKFQQITNTHKEYVISIRSVQTGKKTVDYRESTTQETVSHKTTLI